MTTATSTMTSRERMLAAFRGEEVDRFPVWLKMANPTWRSPQPEPYRSMPDDELLKGTGCDLMSWCGTGCDSERPHVTESVDRTEALSTTIIETPDGTLKGVDKHDPLTGSWHPSEYCVKSERDLKALRWYYKDTSFSVSDEEAETAKARQKELAETGEATTSSGIGPSPLMHMMQHLAGPENTIFLMMDHPDLFREVIEVMHQSRIRHLEALLPHIVADTFWLTENTTTSLLSPEMFREFCVPHLTAYGNLVLENDIIPVHHMCGLLNAILEDIDGLPAMVNEAYTTPPVGNTTLVEGRTRMPSKCLMGGTNATLWLQSADEILETVAADVAGCPDRRKIFLTSAGVLPAAVSFEKARQVVEGLKVL